ncbi:MAG: hypothetical protein LBJ76_01745, partial [Candidatus Accumulibacter sp.]|nr:hypothetical protein [Accumulibacter sp.]
MPGIPTYDNFKATPDILPGARLHAPDLNVEASARGMRVLGKGLDDMGGALSKITFDLQDQANTARVTEALNTLKERQLYLTYDKDAGFRSLKGKNALERPDKKSLDAEYTELLDTARVSLAASLGNDRQRAMFARESGSLMATFRGNLVRHQAEEFRNYQIATHKGVIDVSGQEIALDPANAKAVRNALFRVAASVFEIGRLEGGPADKTDTATRIAQSAAIRGATLTLLDENDAGGAKAFFEAQKDSMTAEDKVSLQSLIKKETDLQSGLQAAQGAFQVLARQRKPDPAQRGFEIAMEAVGRLEYDENGNELPVSGSSMVLEKRKEEYERKVDRFDGDLEKVFAAYDLEDVSIENAIKKAEAENKKLKAGEIPKTWKDFIPEQTRVFVEKQMGQFDAGKSIVKPPTLRNAVSAILSNERLSPPAKKIAMEEVSRLYKQQEAEQKAEAGAAMHEAYLWLSENGYDFNRLPVKIMETVRETAPEKLDDLAAFSKRMKETGGGITDPKALAEYRQMASTSPAAFVGIDFTGVDDLDASD